MEGSGTSEATGELGDPAHTANHHMALTTGTHQDTLSASQASIFSSAFPKESNTLRPYGQKLTLKSGTHRGSGGRRDQRELVNLDVDTKLL